MVVDIVVLEGTLSKKRAVDHLSILHPSKRGEVKVGKWDTVPFDPRRFCAAFVADGTVIMKILK